MDWPQGIPSDARALITKLLDAPPIAATLLRQDLQAHLEAVHAASKINAHLDPHLAARLVEVCGALLDEAERQGTDDARRLAQAAVRYFVEDEDGEHDLDSVVGMVDDAEVCNAIARALGRGDLVTDT